MKRSSSFSPAKYIYRRGIPGKDSHTKGGSSNNSSDSDIDVEKIRTIVSNLRKKAHIEIKALKDSDKENLGKIVKYIDKLINTNAYPILENIVDEYFSDLDEIRSGTIGAFFSGCNISGKDPCSDICAGNMPRRGTKYQYCDKNMYIAKYTDNGFDFAEYSTVNDSTHAYIFLEYENMSDFPGFTEEEKLKLKAKGIQYVYFVGRDSNTSGNRTNKPLTTAITIDSIKHRESKKKNPKKDKCNNDDTDDNYNWVIILFVVVLIILFLILLYICSESSTTTYKTNYPHHSIYF